MAMFYIIHLWKIRDIEGGNTHYMAWNILFNPIHQILVILLDDMLYFLRNVWMCTFKTDFFPLEYVLDLNWSLILCIMMLLQWRNVINIEIIYLKWYKCAFQWKKSSIVHVSCDNFTKVFTESIINYVYFIINFISMEIHHSQLFRFEL